MAESDNHSPSVFFMVVLLPVYLISTLLILMSYVISNVAIVSLHMGIWLISAGEKLKDIDIIESIKHGLCTRYSTPNFVDPIIQSVVIFFIITIFSVVIFNVVSLSFFDTPIDWIGRFSLDVDKYGPITNPYSYATSFILASLFAFGWSSRKRISSEEGKETLSHMSFGVIVANTLCLLVVVIIFYISESLMDIDAIFDTIGTIGEIYETIFILSIVSPLTIIFEEYLK